VKRFAADSAGGTAIEYAMIVSLVSIMVVTWATNIGMTLDGIFKSLIGSL